MKKLIIALALMSFGAGAAVSTGEKQLPAVVKDNMYCVGYNQAIYENSEPDTSVNNEAEAAMQFFYNRGFDLEKKYNVDDGEPDSGGGKDSEALNWAFSLGYATYLHDKKPMPEKCIKVYGNAVQNMSDKEVLEPYNK